MSSVCLIEIVRHTHSIGYVLSRLYYRIHAYTVWLLWQQNNNNNNNALFYVLFLQTGACSPLQRTGHILYCSLILAFLFCFLTVSEFGYWFRTLAVNIASDVLRHVFFFFLCLMPSSPLAKSSFAFCCKY